MTQRAMITCCQDAIDADGAPTGGAEEAKRWSTYTGRSLSQLEWWAGEA